jgi:3-oxoacyl-[acyl-carrier-protein] synthase III
VKKQLKRKITLDEVIPVKEQARQVLQQKMDGNFVLLLRKQEMINQMKEELKKQGKTNEEIDHFLVDIRSGNTQAARAVWQQVVFNN